MAIYEQIGKGYDLTRRADPYITSRLAQHLQIKPDGLYLDVACGTGNYTVALAEFGGIWQGIDQSSLMIDAANNKSHAVDLLVGSVESLPYSNQSFSGVLCTLAIHHFADIISAFQEIYRVLANGKFVLFTATPEQMQKYWLIEYFPEAISKASQQMPSLDSVKSALDKVGFKSIQIEAYSIHQDLQDLFLYSGKHRPELYLDANIRSGISTFSGLASVDEITNGCQKLATDINSGFIKEVVHKYEHEQGDYLFIIADKNQ
ncbi:putative MerR-family transcriptional regulator [Nostoc sp. NIES-3756]|uniref:class I SAM-dependent methyltransferase n=1 Tax=Nostoc sp. NIES-3756 TaxID=1751286 RepID=UPI000721B617|nr:class I SAM-dependent methyltransferase [Nostoc sp. NIES-3756]BAT51711.1 putative MerR-family transcriptional regulator [Nostoc sp. NIES-3756]